MAPLQLNLKIPSMFTLEVILQLLRMSLFKSKITRNFRIFEITGYGHEIINSHIMLKTLAPPRTKFWKWIGILRIAGMLTHLFPMQIFSTP